MSFPAPSVQLPNLTPWQLAYGDFSFGGVVQGSTFQLQEIAEGLDPPDYVTGDVQRALDQGEYLGLDLSPGRNIVVKQVIAATTAKALDVARQELGAVLGPRGNVEEPLFLQLPNGLFASMARPRKHKCPVGTETVFGYATIATTAFHATDPRWYAVPVNSSTVGLPEVAGGIKFPIKFPIVFAAAGGGNIVTVENLGGFETRPLLVVTGPCTNPRITCRSQPGAPGIGFELVLNASDTLTIDLDWQSAVLRTAGTVQGSSRRSSEQPGNDWFNCPPGNTELAFTSEDKVKEAGTLTVQWASAYMGL
jgi:hypothetical protein